MKRSILLLILVLIALPAISQTRKYKKAMVQAIELMDKTNDRESALQSVVEFEEIALTFPDQWIPLYNAAQVLIPSSFEESDIATSDEMLGRALKHLEKAEDLKPEESEIEVMKGMYFIGLMSSDPATRGPMYYEGALTAIQKARKLNPENPRAIYLDGMMALNMPEFMGGGPAAAKPIFLEAAETFQTFSNEDPFWPGWGEKLNMEQLLGLEDLSNE